MFAFCNLFSLEISKCVDQEVKIAPRTEDMQMHLQLEWIYISFSSQNSLFRFKCMESQF
jgi:hypothetical protein